jgi:hypothetical protein
MAMTGATSASASDYRAGTAGYVEPTQKVALETPIWQTMLFWTSLGTGLLSANAKASALRAQGEYERRMNRANAEIARLQAKDVISRGEAEAGEVGRQGAKFMGSQVAGAAGQGVDVSTGSMADIQAQSRKDISKAVQTVRQNAWREAFGYRHEARQYNLRGELAVSGAKRSQFETLLGGGFAATRNIYKAYGSSGTGDA